MAQTVINKFAAISPKRTFMAVGSDGYAYEVNDIGKASLCSNEQDADSNLVCWIKSYPNVFGQFKIVPVTLIYDLDKAIKS